MSINYSTIFFFTFQHMSMLGFAFLLLLSGGILAIVLRGEASSLLLSLFLLTQSAITPYPE